MPALDLPLLIDAARIAGRVATSYTGPAAQCWDKPDGAGPVSEAVFAKYILLFLSSTAERRENAMLLMAGADQEKSWTNDNVIINVPIDGIL